MVGGLLGAGSFQAWGQETSQVASPKSGKITGIVTAKTDKDITVSGAMHDICFENIRVNDVRQLIHCWIGQDMWGQDSQRGHVDGVLFKNITVTGPDFPRSRLLGFDATHLIENVAFRTFASWAKRFSASKTARYRPTHLCETCVSAAAISRGPSLRLRRAGAGLNVHIIEGRPTRAIPQAEAKLEPPRALGGRDHSFYLLVIIVAGHPVRAD